MRCEQLTHSAARVKGVHQPRPGAVAVPPAGGGGRCPPVPTRAQAEGSLGTIPKPLRAHRPWPCRLPWTPAGKGSKGWVHRATEAALPNPGEGSERPVRDNKRGDQWPSGRNRAVRRSLPVETPTQPRLPPASPCNPAGTSQQNKHISTPHPEPLSEHVTRAMWRRGTQGTRPHFDHANTLVPHPLLGQR